MMSPRNDDSSRCPECHSDDIHIESSREIRRKGREPEDQRPVVARIHQLRCSECGCDWSVTKRISPPTPPSG